MWDCSVQGHEYVAVDFFFMSEAEARRYHHDEECKHCGCLNDPDLCGCGSCEDQVESDDDSSLASAELAAESYSEMVNDMNAEPEWGE